MRVGDTPSELKEAVRVASLEIDRLDQAAATARHQRDQLIRQAFAAGIPVADIAVAAGLTGHRVSQVLGHPHRKRGRPRRDAR